MNNKLSIICATYNASSTIEKFLDSVRNQTCKLFELIIIDGGSTDNTVELIKAHSQIITVLLSETDDGIYDAWNKGVRLSKTEWICFVGADDIIHPTFIEKYIDAIEKVENNNAEIDYISSKVNYVDEHNRTLRILGQPWCWEQFKYSMTTAHVGSLHSKELFNQVGLFDINYKIIGDYELLLRKRNNLKTYFIDDILVDMKADGVSLSLNALIERTKAQINTAKIHKLVAGSLLVIGSLLLFRLKMELRFGIRRIKL